MIKDNIKKLRQKHGLTQSELGRIAGVSDKAVSTWERGDAEPRMGAVEKMAAYFRISKSAIIDNVTVPEARELPILGEICAGPGIFCDENYSGAFYIDKSVKADCCLVVSGDSMRDAGIQDKDIAFVKKTGSIQRRGHRRGNYQERQHRSHKKDLFPRIGRGAHAVQSGLSSGGSRAGRDRYCRESGRRLPCPVI